MKAKTPAGRVLKGLGASVEEEDLDVTPVMNIFIILIPFLVSMSAFIQLSIIELSLPKGVSEGEGSGGADNNEQLELTLAITDMGFRISGTGQVLPVIPKIENQYDFHTLSQHLAAIKSKYAKQDDITLAIESQILYDIIIKVMDRCRENGLGNIALSGGVF